MMGNFRGDPRRRSLHEEGDEVVCTLVCIVAGRWGRSKKKIGFFGTVNLQYAKNKRWVFVSFREGAAAHDFWHIVGVP